MFGFIDISGGQNRPDLFLEVVFFDELKIGISGDNESIGDRDVDFVHFSQIGTFAAHNRNVVVVYLVKPKNVFVGYCHPRLVEFLIFSVSSERL